MPENAIVIGAGIVGLAMARALAIRGYEVTVIERTEKAVGASVRNFGMLWPIGQPDGELFETAMLSKSIWKTVAEEAGIWYDEVGSLHIAKSKEEWQVLQELASVYQHRGYRLLDPVLTVEYAPAVVNENLYGSLFSGDEMIVDPRRAIAAIPGWLNEKFGVQFIWGKAITDIAYPSVYAGKEEWEASEIYVCSGADFETLYPEIYTASSLTKCKLQMMRMKAQPGNERIGPSLCGGLSLVHYNSFKAASSWQQLKEKFQSDYPEYLKWGIHVMVSQNESGELTVGDSHEYALTHDPFDKQFINQLILDYLGTFARFKDETI
ncbi:MAG: TIGR03364 family FAD-dependent oxidoreductase, partial [Bacteroidetes bacterium]|nr:TIGR03364 family FAD-dependent oxidoreductase [Bacteroidota bacterium]